MPVRTILWNESIRGRIERGGSHFLERASLRALSAATATVYLDVATSDQPDLVLLPAEPLDMPVVEVVRMLRGDPRTRSLRIAALCAADAPAEALRRAGCDEVIDAAIDPAALQEKIAAFLGLRLRRHPRYQVVLPVSRGRIFREFLGYSNSVSVGGMGFETLARIRPDEHLPLRLYRNTEERPIAVTARVAGVRPNIDTGVGYAVGVEFVDLAAADRRRLVELFPRDAGVAWGEDPPRGTPGSR